MHTENISHAFTGPQHWGEQYDTCFGKHQSPININLLTVQEVKFPNPLKMEGFEDQIDGLVLANNGHTGTLICNYLYNNCWIRFKIIYFL